MSRSKGRASVRLTWLLALAATAFAQIQQPQLGLMLARDGSARPVYGVTSSVTLGNPITTGVLSSGCSKLVCLMKTDSSIVSSTGVAAAPRGRALFSFDGNSALVYFPATRQLKRWNADQLTQVDFSVAGEILSVGQTTFAIRNTTGTWIVAPDNTVLQSLHQATGPVLLLDTGVLFATPTELLLRRPDGSELQFPIDKVESLSWLGQNYVQARTRGANYAVRIDPGHERMFLLPEQAQ
jgi:hypothetical protein